MNDEEFRRKSHEIIDELPRVSERGRAFLEELLISKCEAAAMSGNAEVVGSERRRVQNGSVRMSPSHTKHWTSRRSINGFRRSTSARAGSASLSGRRTKVRVGDYVELSFTAPGHERCHHRTGAESGASRPQKSGKGYEAGVEFIHITRNSGG